MWTKLIIVAFLAVIVYNLGAGLYYMMTDKSGSDRVVKALTRSFRVLTYTMCPRCAGAVSLTM